jgi:choline dehydrogenase
MDAYDVIVVGAGTAGCVLTARLTERADARVLVIEAGSREPLPAMGIPPAWPTLTNSQANWGESTVVQAATGTAPPLHRGRALGGSSAINAMVFARGHRSSYDAWATPGAISWGFDDLLPYFRRSENAPGRDPALRGRGGPLTVAPADPVNPVLASSLDAVVEAGLRRADDVSGGLEEGFGPTDLNIVAGRRQSAADAYLLPAAGRPHLDIVTDAVVHRLRVEKGRCTGVDYQVGGELVSVAGTEVVVSAGAIGTPQLLMLSGVGPHSHLRQHGIQVVHDLPGVGENLQDHPMAYLAHGACRPVPPGENNHGEVIGLVRSDPSLGHPDLQFVLVDIPLLVEGFPSPNMATPMPCVSCGRAVVARSGSPVTPLTTARCSTRTTTATAGTSMRSSLACASPAGSQRRARWTPGAPARWLRGLTGTTMRHCGSTQAAP